MHRTLNWPDTPAPGGSAPAAGLNTQHAELLGRIELFASLDRLALAKLASYLDPLPIDAGQVLFHQGDSGDALYLISAGTFGVFGSGSGVPAEVRLNTLGVGESVGELALISGEGRSATVRADTRGEVLRLERDRFLALARQDSAVAMESPLGWPAWPGGWVSTSSQRSWSRPDSSAWGLSQWYI